MKPTKERLKLAEQTQRRLLDTDLPRFSVTWKSEGSTPYSRPDAPVFFTVDAPPPQGFRMGLKFRLGSLWMGAHWSPQNKRLCINLIPCVTLWVVLPGGVAP